ncbi:MAG: hypothetical protein ABSC32_03425 [Steroidobacteraceae bacterium]|jgi:hypothetical protein
MPVERVTELPAASAADERNQADTELLRRAAVHYRALFDELLEIREPERPVLRADGLPVA